MESSPAMPSPDRVLPRSTPGQPVLEAEQVVKRFGAVPALAGVSLTVRHGECVALVGESGAGKTTLLRLFNRTVLPDTGDVRVGGRRAADLDEVRLRREIGFVQQEGGLLPHWDVLKNVALVPSLQGLPDAERRAHDALARVGLSAEEMGYRWPRELSGGQRQRVAIARALAADPEVVLLDEPFGALDAITRAELQESFRGLVKGLRLTVLLVTHDLNEALLLADRVAVMWNGRVEQIAAPDALLRTPATGYVERLLERARVVR